MKESPVQSSIGDHRAPRRSGQYEHMAGDPIPAAEGNTFYEVAYQVELVVGLVDPGAGRANHGRLRVVSLPLRPRPSIGSGRGPFHRPEHNRRAQSAHTRAALRQRIWVGNHAGQRTDPSGNHHDVGLGVSGICSPGHSYYCGRPGCGHAPRRAPACIRRHLPPKVTAARSSHWKAGIRSRARTLYIK